MTSPWPELQYNPTREVLMFSQTVLQHRHIFGKDQVWTDNRKKQLLNYQYYLNRPLLEEDHYFFCLVHDTYFALKR